MSAYGTLRAQARSSSGAIRAARAAGDSPAVRTAAASTRCTSTGLPLASISSANSSTSSPGLVIGGGSGTESTGGSSPMSGTRPCRAAIRTAASPTRSGSCSVSSRVTNRSNCSATRPEAGRAKAGWPEAAWASSDGCRIRPASMISSTTGRAGCGARRLHSSTNSANQSGRRAASTRTNGSAAVSQPAASASTAWAAVAAVPTPASRNAGYGTGPAAEQLPDHRVGRHPLGLRDRQQPVRHRGQVVLTAASTSPASASGGRLTRRPPAGSMPSPQSLRPAVPAGTVDRRC